MIVCVIVWNYENFFADRWCPDDSAITPYTGRIETPFRRRVRARHETVSVRIKQCEILLYPFTHYTEKHGTALCCT